MYSEMLAEGMVPDAAKRRQYLDTLCSEANRLSHLVENVLAYARLERGSARSRVERITLGELVERVKPRLVERAEQAGMKLVEDADEPARCRPWCSGCVGGRADPVQPGGQRLQVRRAERHREVIHLEALPENGKFAMLRVRDHGQGISAPKAQSACSSRSANRPTKPRTPRPAWAWAWRSAAGSAAAWAATCGWTACVKDGACFVLRLPVIAPGAVNG